MLAIAPFRSLLEAFVCLSIYVGGGKCGGRVDAAVEADRQSHHPLKPEPLIRHYCCSVLPMFQEIW